MVQVADLHPGRQQAWRSGGHRERQERGLCGVLPRHRAYPAGERQEQAQDEPRGAVLQLPRRCASPRFHPGGKRHRFLL